MGSQGAEGGLICWCDRVSVGEAQSSDVHCRHMWREIGSAGDALCRLVEAFHHDGERSLLPDDGF